MALTNNEKDKYKHDIETIKDILLKTEEKPLFESWAFFTYGIFFLAGGLINYLIISFMKISVTDIFFRLWLPILLFLMLLEPLALIKKMSKESLPLLSKTIIKLYLGVFGSSGTMIFILIIVGRTGHINLLPPVFLCFWAIAYLFYAQVSSSLIFIHSYILIIAGVFIYFAIQAVDIQIIVTAFILGISCIVIGFTEYIKDKKIYEK